MKKPSKSIKKTPTYPQVINNFKTIVGFNQNEQTNNW